MSFSIARKLTLGICVLLAAGTFTLFIVYQGLVTTRKVVEDVVDTKQSISTAVHEMEINVIGTGLGVMKYLETGHPRYRQRVQKDEADFARFQAQYHRLVDSPRGGELSAKVDRLYAEYRALGALLMNGRDQKSTLQTALASNFAHLEQLFDQKLGEVVRAPGLDEYAKVTAVGGMHREVGDATIHLEQYLRTLELADRQRASAEYLEFLEHLRRFKNLTLTAQEQQWVDEISRLSEQREKRIREVLALHDRLQESTARFLELREILDALLDDEIQPLAAQNLTAAATRAKETFTAVLIQLSVLYPLVIGLCVGVTLVLIRVIKRPLNDLLHGTQEIAGGKLGVRLGIRGSDEFAEVAAHFNQMAAELERTTVSKTLLEQSDAQLRQANRELQQEVGDRERAESALRDKHSQLEATLNELRETQAHALQQERLAAVGQLAAGIAHDFNNILTSVMGFAELIQRANGLPDTCRNAAQTIVSQSERAAHLIRQILDFSRQSPVDSHAVQMPQVLIDTSQLLERTLPENIRVRLELETTDARIWSDEGRLQQALTNLALNARDAMLPHGGELRFHLWTRKNGLSPALPSNLVPGHWAVVEVSDTGSGMPQEIMDHILEPFFTTKEVGQGTGLGLAQVYGIVTQHGGHISVRSTPGQGTIFTLYFPLLPDDPVQDGSSEGATLWSGNGETVLVVEDEAPVRAALHAMVEGLQYRVLVASSGAEALRVYDQHRETIKVVLTDMVMPEVDGAELSQTLLHAAPQLNIVLLSGYAQEGEVQRLMKMGRVQWLQKPCPLPALARALRQACSRAR